MSPEIFILPASILGAVSTYWLNHDLRVGAIRASTGATLAFVVLTLPLPQAWLPMLRASFFGATFVGMATTERFTRRQVAAGATLYGLLYMLILRAPPHIREPGGVLGTSAFLAGITVAGFDLAWAKLAERSRATEAAIPPQRES